MSPHKAKYHALREQAKRVHGKVGRQELVQQLAAYIVGELRRLGFPDEALCAWARLPGFTKGDWWQYAKNRLGSFTQVALDAAAVAKLGRITPNPIAVWGKSQRATGIEMAIHSCYLRRAIQEAVLTETKEFRAPIEAARVEAERQARNERISRQKEQKELVYTPPFELPHDSTWGRWNRPRHYSPKTML